MAVKSKGSTSSKPEPKTKASASISPENLMREISIRAYELHIERGNAPGSDIDDWLKAEKEVKAKY